MPEEEIVEGETTENTTEEATEEAVETKEEATTEENTEEEATEEAEDEEDKSSDLEAKNRQLFERAKKAEEKLKAMEKAGKVNKEKSTGDNLDYILEVQSATKGLDAEEVEELRLRAKAKDYSLSEARKDENFVLWQKARKEKVAKAKALDPSTKQAEVKKAKTPEQRLAEAKTLEEQGKILDELGLNPINQKGYIDNWEEGMG
jgi:colicin import membrane protein